MLHLLYICECIWRRLSVWNVSYCLNSSHLPSVSSFANAEHLFCSNLACFHVSLLSTQDFCIENFHTFESDHIKFLLLFLSSHWNFIFSPKQRSFPPHLFAPLSVACHIIIICMKSKFNCIRTIHKDICTSSPRSLFLSVFSIYTPPPNAALRLPLYEMSSSDHGLFLLSFPLSDSLLSSFYHFHLGYLTLWLLKTIPNLSSARI